MTAAGVLQRLVREIVIEIEANPEFGARVLRALQSASSIQPTHNEPSQAPRRGRRSPGPLDPFAIHRAHGMEALRAELSRLPVEQLKDIVAEHGMDSSKLALKWKNADRLIQLIATTVADRLSKGDAFR